MTDAHASGIERARRVSPSVNPPSGLEPAQVPQFVAFTFDDNGKSGMEGAGTFGGMSYVLDIFDSRKNPEGRGNRATFDGTPTRFTFYAAGFYAGPGQWENGSFVKKIWKKSVDAGHEIGNHTYNHPNGNGKKFTAPQWEEELRLCNECLMKPFKADETPATKDDANGIGIPRSDIIGFRAPFLGYNDNLFHALSAMGFSYDCSISEGFESDQDGTNFFWPFTLDDGSPSDKITCGANGRDPVGSHKGLWELPTYALVVPPDGLCEKYGATPGLRSKLAKLDPSFDAESGKIIGLDWNMWSPYEMCKEEFVATWKYSFDLKISGNRSPAIMCLHTDIYADDYDDPMPNATPQDRRDALKECYDYALGKKDARLVTMKNLLGWLENPVAL